MVNNAEADSLDLWSEPLTVDERERLLDTVAEGVRRRGLTTPVLFFVEINRPLGFIASQGIIALAPMLAPLIGLERVQTVGRLLADSRAVDDLVRRLSDGTLSPPTPPPPTRGSQGPMPPLSEPATPPVSSAPPSPCEPRVGGGGVGGRG